MYRRRYRRFRRGRSRSRFIRKRSFRRFRRRVNRAVNSIAEKKYFDYSLSLGVGEAGWLVPLTNQIATGVDEGFRVGNRIFLRYIKSRFQIDSENEDGMFMRIALLRGRTLGLGLPDLPSGPNGITAMIDIDKWEIITDRSFSLGDADTNGMNKTSYNPTWRIMKNLIYNTGQINSQVTNLYYLWIWSNDVITTGVNFQGVARLYYTDI